jgi:hypothetical protein
MTTNMKNNQDTLDLLSVNYFNFYGCKVKELMLDKTIKNHSDCVVNTIRVRSDVGFEYCVDNIELEFNVSGKFYDLQIFIKKRKGEIYCKKNRWTLNDLLDEYIYKIEFFNLPLVKNSFTKDSLLNINLNYFEGRELDLLLKETIFKNYSKVSFGSHKQKDNVAHLDNIRIIIKTEEVLVILVLFVKESDYIINISKQYFNLNKMKKVKIDEIRLLYD